MMADARRTSKTKEQSISQAGKESSRKKTVGRPKGPPSTIINLRIPLDLLEQLDRYLDHLEVHTGLKANRGMIARRALELFLETRATGESEPWTQRSQR
jgi:hypothetical protein